MSFLDDKEGVAVNGHAYFLSDYFSEADFISEDGNHFVLHDPLLNAAKDLLGIESKTVELCHVGDTSAAVKVRYNFKGDYQWEAMGEFSQANAKGKFGQYPVSMAETRASSRALRFALGVSFCSYDEIKSGGTTVVNVEKIENYGDKITNTQEAKIKKLCGALSIDSAEFASDILDRQVGGISFLTLEEGAKVFKAIKSKYEEATKSEKVQK